MGRALRRRPQGTGQQQRQCKQSGQQYPGRDEQSAYGVNLEVTDKATTFSIFLDYPVEDRSERPSLPGLAGMAFNFHASTSHTASNLFT